MVLTRSMERAEHPTGCQKYAIPTLTYLRDLTVMMVFASPNTTQRGYRFYSMVILKIVATILALSIGVILAITVTSNAAPPTEGVNSDLAAIVNVLLGVENGCINDRRKRSVSPAINIHTDTMQARLNVVRLEHLLTACKWANRFNTTKGWTTTTNITTLDTTTSNVSYATNPTSQPKKYNAMEIFGSVYTASFMLIVYLSFGLILGFFAGAYSMKHFMLKYRKRNLLEEWKVNQNNDNNENTMDESNDDKLTVL